ncbi:MAG: 50S ribosomal protein L23 [Candidatus Omnitrophica bacterium]|nr:50S ribosomal protein L23 [Candidatus Omnitrophota bacterium]
MKNVYDLIRNPLLTEKGSIQQADHNKYFFKVDVRANKKEIKEAVEKIYNVKVTKVHTMNIMGKFKRVRYQPGRTSDWKKAIVTLKPGDVIDFT